MESLTIPPAPAAGSAGSLYTRIAAMQSNPGASSGSLVKICDLRDRIHELGHEERMPEEDENQGENGKGSEKENENGNEDG
jgi:hypothetical protein